MRIGARVCVGCVWGRVGRINGCSTYACVRYAAAHGRVDSARCAVAWAQQFDNRLVSQNSAPSGVLAPSTRNGSSMTDSPNCFDASTSTCRMPAERSGLPCTSGASRSTQTLAW